MYQNPTWKNSLDSSQRIKLRNKWSLFEVDQIVLGLGLIYSSSARPKFSIMFACGFLPVHFFTKTWRS